MSLNELARLKVLMGRIQSRETHGGDVKPLGGGLLEARLDGDDRIFRLIYVEEQGGLLLLGLCFFRKTSQKTPPKEIRTAKKRLKEWRKGQK